MKNISWTSWDAIRNEGFSNHTIFLDIDGVLMAHAEDTVRADILPHVKNLIQKNDVYLLTNSLRKDRAPNVAAQLNIPWIQSPYRKPNPRILRYATIDPEKSILVIGDKFLTDGLFSILTRTEGRLVRPRLRNEKDNLLTVCTYILDDFVGGFLKFLYSR